MNPGEQDQNPFRRPGSFVGSQTSAAPSNTPNTSKYFGARSRFNRNRGTTQTANTQKPSFASYAAEPSYPTQQPKYVSPAAKKRKKIIAIAGLSIAGIVVLIALGSAIITNTGILNIGKNHNLSDLQSLLEKYYPHVHIAWTSNEHCYEGKNWLRSPDIETDNIKKEKDNLSEVENGIKEFMNQIENYGGIKAIDDNGEVVELDNRLKIIKNNTKKLQEFFTKYRKVYDLVFDIYISKGKTESIEALKNASGDEKYARLANYFKSYYSAEEQLKKIVKDDPECRSDLCRKTSIERSDYEDNINDGTFDKILEQLYVELDEEEHNTMFLFQEIHSMKPVEEK